MGPDVPLDTIIKKFTIVYGNVKSFDLLMRDFYRADQGEEESIPSFATWFEGLLSQIHDKFPEKFTPPEEQRLLKDRLFHGCKKSIWDSVKYCFADPRIDYMHFLEECRKAEDEDKVGETKSNPPKAKVAAATVPPEGPIQQEGQGCKPKTHGEEVQGAEVCLGRPTLEPLPSPGPETPS